MTTQYESLHPDALYAEAFGVDAPAEPVGRKIWPRQPGLFIRRTASPAVEPAENAPAHTAESTPEILAAPGRELVRGQFGLVPRWVKSASDAKLRSTKLVNARHETVTTSNNFREAWLGAQRCIVPLMAFIVDDYRKGKAVPTRISRVDGQPMGVAGLWEHWHKDGETIVSFCLLTVNANSHALMHRYEQPGSEKRMPAILGEGAYSAWLNASTPDKARDFMRAFAAESLTANPVLK